MKVTLDPRIFTSLTDLLPFLQLGIEGRHRIFVDDPDADPYAGWRSGLEATLRQDWDQALESGFRLEAQEPSHHEIYVSVGQSSAWTLPPPRLVVGDAIKLLQRPYRILVENGISDGAFLLCMCSPRERRWLDDRLEREWVEIEHCGGNDHLEKRVRDIRKDKHKSMRASALFDSDALQPGVPGPTARAIELACEPEVHHHQLARRAIENYLPRAALQRWCKQVQGQPRRDRERIVDAFFKLNEPQRAHYNMKRGFERDAHRAHEAGALFEGLSVAATRALAAGFDERIATLYQNGAVRFDEIERVDAVAKVTTFVTEAIERIR